MLTEKMANEMLERLTPKHREVLDLINEHNSNKEVARRLGVAPSTVEYRLRSVRALWNTENRNATMRLYNELLTACESTRGEKEALARSAAPQQMINHLPASRTLRPDAPQNAMKYSLTVSGDTPTQPSKLDALDASFGSIGRAVLILLMAFVIVMIGAVSLFVADALSRLG